MSLKANIEVIINVLNFRQLDSFINGQYKMQFRVSHKQQAGQESRSIYGKPYLLPSESRSLTSERTFETPEFIAGSSNRMPLNEICGFRLEVDCLPDFPGEAYVEVYLLLFGLQNEWIKKYPPDKKGYSAIGKSMLRILTPHSPLSEFTEIIFDDLICCSTSVVVHSFLIGYKLASIEAPLALPMDTYTEQPPINLEELFKKLIDNNHETLMRYEDSLGSRLIYSLEKLEMFLEKAFEAIFNSSDFKKMSSAKTLREDFKQLCKSIEGIKEIFKAFKAEVTLRTQQYDTLETKPDSYLTGMDSRQKSFQQFDVSYMTQTNDPENKMMALGRALAPSFSSRGPRLDTVSNYNSSRSQSENSRTLFPLEINKFPEIQVKRLSSGAIEIEIRKMLAHFHDCYSCIYQLINILVEILQESSDKICLHLKEKYHENFRERLMVHFFTSVTKVKNLSETVMETPYSKADMAEVARSKARVLDYELMRVEDISFFDKTKLVPIFFECKIERNGAPKDKVNQPSSNKKLGLELDIPQNPFKSNETSKGFITHRMSESKSNNAKYHLLVLVHGYKGCDFDMRVYKNHLMNSFPRSLCMISNINSTAEEAVSIFKLGENLAKEVKQYLIGITHKEIDRISFIGHSLGGLVIRAALPLLAPFKSKFYTYMSLGTPHMGFIHTNSFLVSTGLKILKAWTSSTILSELDFTDQREPTSRSLFKLSTAEGLDWFKNVLLVGSPQDGYCPRDSSHMQVSPEKAIQKDLGQFLFTMSENLMNRINSVNLTRVDVDIRSNENSIDWMTGRAPHIMFIDNHMIVLTLFFRYFEYFN